MKSQTLRSVMAEVTHLRPSGEDLGIDPSYVWLSGPPKRSPRARLKSVWYVALPITTAHRGGHSGGGLIPGVPGQERYSNEGTVYPHAALVEMITYHSICHPDVAWRYIDLSHETWEEVYHQLIAEKPDVIAISTHTATALWSYIVAAASKVANPKTTVILGNDHASVLATEILTGEIGHRLIDYIGLGNNGPFTMMALLSYLQGQLDLREVPSIAYRSPQNDVCRQVASTFPIASRELPDYSLINDYLAAHYDPAFQHWYCQHYELQRMVTLQLDGGCSWGADPDRRCRHCAIQGLAPKIVDIPSAVTTIETVVGDLHANVYDAGDSTLGLSRNQWGGKFTFVNDLAQACADSTILRDKRFMLCYGLPSEFAAAARLCRGFVRTWNVGIESFDRQLLRGDAKGVNTEAALTKALQLAVDLDYRIYASGILGLAGTTLRQLNREVKEWLRFAETYQEILTTISVAPPALLPGSWLYYTCYKESAVFRSFHGELPNARRLTSFFIDNYTSVRLGDVEAAVRDVGRGVIATGTNGGNPLKFGGYMFGGSDPEEKAERALLTNLLRLLP